MKKIFTVFAILFAVLFAGKVYARVIDVANQYIRISVDDLTGRFMMETVGGDPDSPLDNDKQLLYKKIPPTSMTTMSINGELIIFGSEQGSYKRRAEVQDNKIITEWSVRGINIVQEISIIKGPSTGREDCMRIVYKIVNNNRQTTAVGARILFDTFLGDTDGAPFRIPGIGDISREALFYRADIPDYWYSFDSFEHPTIRSQGILRGSGVTVPDRVIFASWDRLYDNLWDLNIDSSRELRQTGTSRFDSAVALLYEPLKLEKDDMMIISALYGLYGVSFFSSDQLTMSLSVPAEPNMPPVPVSVEVMNTSQSTLDSLTLNLTLPEGFRLAENESNTIEYLRVGPGEVKKAMWYMDCGTIGGNFTVRVNATGVVNNNSQIVTAEKAFTMNFTENFVVSQNDQNVQLIESQISQQTVQNPVHSNVIVVVPVRTNTVTVQNVSTAPVISQEEIDLMKEIDDLTKLIDEVNQKYQVLLGIYRNTYLSNELISNINLDLNYYHNRVREEETKLSNQIGSSLR